MACTNQSLHLQQLQGTRTFSGTQMWPGARVMDLVLALGASDQPGLGSIVQADST